MQQRIISLVPSQTELLYDLGLSTEVVGITKFCIHPAKWFQTKTRIGGTKTVNIEKVKSLSPTIIIANKEENVKEQVEALQQFAKVYVSDITDLESALQMIHNVGQLVERETKSAELVTRIREQFSKVSSQRINHSTIQLTNAAYLIWKDPFMAAGGDTFIHHMMKQCGLSNVFADQPRYPEITIAQLAELNCNLLLLSSEPYPFKQKHIDELQQGLPGTKILLVDGEMFSWYGSRLLQSPGYFQKLLHQINPQY